MSFFLLKQPGILSSLTPPQRILHLLRRHFPPCRNPNCHLSAAAERASPAVSTEFNRRTSNSAADGLEDQIRQSRRVVIQITQRFRASVVAQSEQAAEGPGHAKWQRFEHRRRRFPGLRGCRRNGSRDLLGSTLRRFVAISISSSPSVVGYGKQTDVAVTFAHFSGRHEGRLRRLARVRPNGMGVAITVTELMGPLGTPGTPTDEHIATFETAVDAVISGEWDKAREILGGLGNEAPIEFLLLRMSEHDNQPPADWDGAFRLQKK